eukprot:9494465-Pyramimonas_sp.AAC.1
MLVPSRFRDDIVWKGDQVDIGQTMLNVLPRLADTELAIELGGQSFNLAYEMVLARSERQAMMRMIDNEAQRVQQASL